MLLGALGVVYGDIGTSPLYTLQTAFTADNGAVVPTPVNVYGVVSLIFWAITIVVSVKYVSLIMRADNRGEGGILALTALIEDTGPRRARAKAVLVSLGILGAALFYGDGTITPAISVLSAVEGLQIVEPSLSAWVVPVTVAVLTALFAIQRYGTAVVGRMFGAVMLAWFLTLAVLGAAEVARHPGILRALSPYYAWQFFRTDGWTAFLSLSSVVLAVTGAEALYADMGQFGQPPIRRAWFLLVFPALILNYLGQGSLVLRTPSAVTNPFYLLVPSTLQLPMVFLATAATVIASQAVITGAFSVTYQAMRLGYLPRLSIRHTPGGQQGRVYVPVVNHVLFVTVTGLVLAFGSSAALASAYGVAVTATFLLNTTLFLVVARTRWHTRRTVIALIGVMLLSVETMFFTASLTKIAHGGWLPLTLAAFVYTVMATWRQGRQIVDRYRAQHDRSVEHLLRDSAASTPPPQQVPGTAVFLASAPGAAPGALAANVLINHIVHRDVIVMTVRDDRRAHVPDADQLTARVTHDAAPRVTHLDVRVGYRDRLDIQAMLRKATSRRLLAPDIDLSEPAYFLTREVAVNSPAPTMPRWRKQVYLFLSRNAADQVEHFKLPLHRTVVMNEETPL